MPQGLKARQTGVTAIEFALVSVLFFGLILATLDMGRVFLERSIAQHMLHQAAREARYDSGSKGLSSFQDALNKQVDALGFLVNKNAFSLQVNFYDDRDQLLNDLASGAYSGGYVSGRRLAVYQASYPLSFSGMSGSGVLNFTLDEDLVVVHEQD